MTMNCNTYLCGLLTVCLVSGMYCWIPSIWNGRPENGRLQPPELTRDMSVPDEQFYEFQTINHFDGSNLKRWKQRYFVNNATYRTGGPIFLMLGGDYEADPVWITGGATYDYALMYGALLVLLEHRYYGKSQPVPDLSTANLEYLSSRQALADTASFITYFRWWNHINNSTKLVLFGGSYAGSLAVWFRAKYPYLCAGAVASSAMVVAEMDYGEFFESIAESLDMTGPRCRTEIQNAILTIYDWYGQPEKRAEMSKMFRLCEKIDYSSMVDFNVLFNNIAQQFADIAVYNKIRTTFKGKALQRVSIDQACDVMTDDSIGNSLERYAHVSNMVLDSHQRSCLNVRYRDLVHSMNHTWWNSTSAVGSRQWLFQSCSEFGWFQSSSSQKQPFGAYFMFPWNLTTDQCIDVFQRIYGGEEVKDNCDETNRYYGGLDLAVSNVVFVNGGVDPWRTASVTTPLKNSPNVDIILIPGTSHCADMYPPVDDDPTELIMARVAIAKLIAKWIS